MVSAASLQISAGTNIFGDIISVSHHGSARGIFNREKTAFTHKASRLCIEDHYAIHLCEALITRQRAGKAPGQEEGRHRDRGPGHGKRREPLHHPQGRLSLAGGRSATRTSL